MTTLILLLLLAYYYATPIHTIVPVLLQVGSSGGSSYGRSGQLPPPIDQKLGLVMAARLRHGGEFSLKSLIFGHFLHKNVKKLSASGGRMTPHQGLCPWTPLGAPPPRPPFRLAMVRPPPWQILDPPLVGSMAEAIDQLPRSSCDNDNV